MKKRKYPNQVKKRIHEAYMDLGFIGRSNNMYSYFYYLLAKTGKIKYYELVGKIAQGSGVLDCSEKKLEEYSEYLNEE